MRKLIISVLLLIAAAICFPQVTEYVLNEATLGWDPVITLDDGSPIPIGDTIEYEIFRSVYPVINPQDPMAHYSYGITLLTEMTVLFPLEGAWSVGVRAIRTTSEGYTRYSEISWSYVSEVTSGNPFIYLFLLPPQDPMNLSNLP